MILRSYRLIASGMEPAEIDLPEQVLPAANNTQHEGFHGRRRPEGAILGGVDGLDFRVRLCYVRLC